MTRALVGARRRLTSAERLTSPSRSLGTSSFDWRISKAAASRPGFEVRRDFLRMRAGGSTAGLRIPPIGPPVPCGERRTTPILPCEQVAPTAYAQRRFRQSAVNQMATNGCSSGSGDAAVRRPRHRGIDARQSRHDRPSRAGPHVLASSMAPRPGCRRLARARRRARPVRRDLAARRDRDDRAPGRDGHDRRGGRRSRRLDAGAARGSPSRRRRARSAGPSGSGDCRASPRLARHRGQSDQIKSLASEAADKVGGWANDACADGGQSAANEAKDNVPAIGETLLKGVAGGIAGLTSLAFFLSFTLFSTFFLLKDGHTIRRFVDRNLGIPQQVARVVTGNVLISLRRYFLGVSIVAAFNAVVVGIGVWLLGIPLVATIAVVTFVTAYVPFIGAFVSGAFAVMLALASEGTGTAAVMLVIVLLANGLLQNILQPVAFGATLDLNPLAVLVVTIAAGSLFGMVGLVLGAPIASAAVHISRDLAAARAAAASSPVESAAPA